MQKSISFYVIVIFVFYTWIKYGEIMIYHTLIHSFYFNENKIKQLTHLRDNLLICCIVETIYYQFSTEQHTVMT